MGCHQSEHEQWQQSDHAMAMALPSNKTVIGNFNNQKAIHYNQEALFFTAENAFKATISDSETGKSETFDIKYTFGHYPLQQYLVETDKGRFQVLPFAWDARPIDQGGQRWYHNYENEPISSADRLHWRQPLQNWNGMCADCHSDELKRNYDPQSNTFNTSYTGINVGCVSCHGVMDGHLLDVQNDQIQESPSSAHNAANQWRLLDGKDTAVWVSEEGEDTAMGKNRNNEFMQTCYACHSLRAPLSDGFSASEDFLDQFAPSLITPPLYFADGQIKEEVYVYGSFLQSKMHDKGVNCLDCHDKHTMKLKVEGNGLCLQCHKASTFDTPTHHKHENFSAGAQCVNCHMPDRTYMGVDDRRDHSFKIPRPDLSLQFDTPNACMDCHQEKGNAWAAKTLKQWFGEPDTRPTKQHLMRLRHGQQISINDHVSIVQDRSLPDIDRASAISLLRQASPQVPANIYKSWLNDTSDLIRLAAAQNAGNLSPQQRLADLTPLLKDKAKSVRIAAAQALVIVPLKQQDQKVFTNAFNELLISNDVSAWRGEGRINQGNLAIQTNDPIGAELALKASVDIDPYFAPAYINLADLYRAKQREDLVGVLLNEGLEKLPQSADILYSYGLHFVRLKQLDKAIERFYQAMKIDPNNAQLAYTYILAKDGKGESRQALDELKVLILTYEDKSALVELGLYLSQKLGSREDFAFFEMVPPP